MSWMKEHRSERPAVWDYANPKAVPHVSLRKRLASKAPPPAPAPARPRKGRKKP